VDNEQRVQASLERFIERLGLFFEEFGIPRIAGRLLGLLLVSEEPLSLDQLATTLRVSRASISTNARLVVGSGLVERISFPGDRRDYYVFGSRGWDALIEADIMGAERLRQFAAEAIDGIGSVDTPARPRLETALTFLDFYGEELRAILARWRERQTKGADELLARRSAG
jgi:hypothetical protein